MFVRWLYSLRARGVPVGTSEWLALHEALGKGLIDGVDALYGLGRALLVHSETQFDAYDLAFIDTFGDANLPELKEALLKWLEDPVPMKDAEGLAEALGAESLEELLRKFEETMNEQTERHDGGNRWVGTGGRSMYGHGGQNPRGMRVGGKGGGRTAVQVAAERRYRDFRDDVTLDVRQFKVALRALRDLGNEGREELSLPKTIDRTCQDAGEINLVFEKERKNRIRLLLLMDAGGSMSPYARLVDRLFTAASELGHWKSFDPYFFHNVPYGRVWTSIERAESVATPELFRKHPEHCKVVFVGDACMAPWELTATGGALALWDRNARSGLQWLEHFRRHFDDVVWLNPEPERYWNHETITTIRRLFPMHPLTVRGIEDAVKVLRHGAPKTLKPSA